METTSISPGHFRDPVNGCSFDQIGYHLDLIVKAGLTARSVSHPAIGFMFKEPSWAGHDFLDSIRNPNVWSKTKQVVSAAGGFPSTSWYLRQNRISKSRSRDRRPSSPRLAS